MMSRGSNPQVRQPTILLIMLKRLAMRQPSGAPRYRREQAGSHSFQKSQFL
jgi:hypothetical protein